MITSGFLPIIRTEIDRAVAEARAHPRDPKAVGALAMTLHAYEQYDAAAPAYSRAHLLEPRNFDWPYLLGAVKMARGDFAGAREAFRSALILRPGDLAASLRLAQSLTSLAEWDEAGTLYRRILDRNPENAQAWYGAGRVAAANGDRDTAARSFAKACELFPAYGAAHFALAGELRRLGRKTEAQQHMTAYSANVTTEPPLDDPLFRRIHDLNHSAQAHLRRALELDKVGRLEESIREHEECLAIDPDNVQAQINLVSLYGRTGNEGKAKEHFDAAVKLNPGRPDAWYNYGVLLFRGQKYAEAEKAFLRALEINPQYAEAHNNLGSIYQSQGRLEDAAREFREAIASQPDYPLARFQLGRILANQNRYDEAIQQFLRSLEPADENAAVYLYALAATYARAGQREQARSYMQKAREAAAARGQAALLTSIERDLKALGDSR